MGISECVLTICPSRVLFENRARFFPKCNCQSAESLRQLLPDYGGEDRVAYENIHARISCEVVTLSEADQSELLIVFDVVQVLDW